jgi:hypothetical protein
VKVPVASGGADALPARVHSIRPTRQRVQAAAVSPRSSPVPKTPSTTRVRTAAEPQQSSQSPVSPTGARKVVRVVPCYFWSGVAVASIKTRRRHKELWLSLACLEHAKRTDPVASKVLGR